MKMISLQEAHDILENCGAVVWGDYFLSYPNVADLMGEDDNTWLRLFFYDDKEGEEYSVDFSEGKNRQVKVIGSSMFPVGEDGEEQITVLDTKELE